MGNFHHTRERVLAVAFSVGPGLLLVGSVLLALGVGLNADGKSSYYEGALGAWGMVLFVPLYFALAKRLGKTFTSLGLICTIGGFFGSAAGVVAMTLRSVQYDLVEQGLTPEAWQAFSNDPGTSAGIWGMLLFLFPLSSMLMGIGYWFSRTLPRWMALSFILAGLLFGYAQWTGSEWALQILYPLSCLLWLAPISQFGWKYLPENTLDEIAPLY